MFGALRQNFSPATLAQLAVELVWLFAAGVAVLHVATQLGNPTAVVVPALVFALLILSLNGAFGVYRRGERVTTSGYVLRLLLAPAIGVPLAYVVANVLPGGREFQEHLGLVVLFGIGGLLLVRHVLVLPLVTTMLPHRVLVLGTGPEARLVEASLASAHPPGLKLCGFFALEKVHESVVSPHASRRRRHAARRRRARPAHQRDHRRRAPAARRRAAAARAARLPARRRRDHRPRALLRARARQGADRAPEGQLADLRQRLSPGLGADARQAHVRPPRRVVAAVPHAAGHGRWPRLRS